MVDKIRLGKVAMQKKQTYFSPAISDFASWSKQVQKKNNPFVENQRSSE